MITCNLSGRLGNLAYEIYNAFYYAQLKNIPFNQLVFNKDYNASCCNYPKYNNLKFFNLKNYIEQNKDFFNNIYSLFQPKDKFEQIKKNLKSVEFSIALKDNSIQNNIDLIKIPSNTQLLRDNNALQLFKKIFFNQKLINANKNIYNDISQRIAIHIRRTDYTDWNNGKCLLTSEKIHQSINNYIKKNNKKFIVFSDDIAWCEFNLKDIKADIIFHKPQEKDYNDLILMSLCKDIYRNGGHSSFSGTAEVLRKCYKL